MRAKKKPAMLEPDMQDAVIYTRYSSHNQRDCSIEQQVADCEIFARQNNLRVVKVYADRHLSGTTDNRPQFQQMLKDAAHGHWAYVICWKIDRFARNRYDSATYKFRLKKAGVRVLYAKESIPDGPEGILLESVLEGSAEYYSAALAQNIRRGMKYNAEQCKVNSGSIPFGYCKGPDGRFAIHEANAEVVREIFRKAAAGMPFVDIANDLNSRGLKTSRGGRWNKGSFRLLMNEAYIGVYHFSDTRIEGGMPALIDQGTFWAANERLKANSSVRGRHQDGGDYLLTGKLKCAHCGSYMIGFSGTGKSGELHYYYGCQKRRRERACKKANVPREWIERVVVKAALDYVLRPDVMEWIADAVMEYQEREAASAQLAALTAELEENQKATDNVMKAIEAGIITSTTKQRLLDLEAKAQDLKRAIELEKLSHVRLERDQVLFWLDRFRGGSLQSQEFRRKVIDAFVSVVYLSDDHLRIAFNYSGGSNAEADFDLVMDAEAAAGELSKKFAQGHVTSTSKKSHLKTYVFQVAFAISAILLRQIRQDVRPQSLLLPQSIEAAVQIHFIDCRKNGAAQQQTLVVERSLRLGGLAAEHHRKTSLQLLAEDIVGCPGGAVLPLHFEQRVDIFDREHRFGDCNVHQGCNLIPGIFFADGVIHHPFFDIVAHHRRGQLHPAETTEVAVDKLHRLIQIQPYRGEIVVPGQGKARSTRRNAEFGFSFHSILFRSCSCTFYKQERCFCAKAGETLSVKALLPVK
jgi:DNA invertase Pin-like site-specific DNA recombinase